MANRVESDGSIKTVATSRLAKGDIVLVQPGQTLPADGILIAGRSHLNVSWLTGESQPLSVSVDDHVIGGTMNIDSPIRIRVSECGKQSRIGQLEEIIRNAAGERTPLVRGADKLGQWFVVIVLGLAVGCWLTWLYRAGIETATLHTVSLLTIACPCAIALAAPLVITVTIGRAARNQIWIRDGECVERLAKPGIIWFDKTGTLTVGEMRVDSWDGSTRSLEFAAAIESQVKHPLAKAICEHVRTEHPRSDSAVDGLRVWEGFGASGRVEASDILVGSERFLQQHHVLIDETWLARQVSIVKEGRTPVWVAVDGMVEGLGAIGDYLRPDAIKTLHSLQSRGWKIGILSGDRQEVADYWEKQLAKTGLRFYQCLGNCSPEQKVATIQASSKDTQGTVAFVGDGMNDAAALAVSDVGIAVRGGSDMGLRAAPVYIASNRLMSIESLMRSADASVRTIHRCFAASLLYNTFTISLAIMGWIHPLIAAVFMPISGLTVLALAITGKTFPGDNRA